eukprot:gene15503-biopygen3688
MSPCWEKQHWPRPRTSAPSAWVALNRAARVRPTPGPHPRSFLPLMGGTNADSEMVAAQPGAFVPRRGRNERILPRSFLLWLLCVDTKPMALRRPNCDHFSDPVVPAPNIPFPAKQWNFEMSTERVIEWPGTLLNGSFQIHRCSS